MHQMVKANGIDIAVESYGPEDGETILLIMGLGAQLTRWPTEFVERFTRRGYRVVRFDNRDVGLSQHFNDKGAVNLKQVIADRMAGKTPDVPYDLDDMAKDAVGVLDALGIKQAHVVGASMGGMIGQCVAAGFPERVLSFTSIFSTTGNPALPPATKEAMAVLTTRAPHPSDEQAYADHGWKVHQTIGSPGFPQEEATIRERYVADGKRAYNPEGVGRQMGAVNATGDRRERLRGIRTPTLVIHGDQDPLVPVTGGHDTAENIPGAKLKIIEGMGHDIPRQLYDEISEAILEHVAGVKATA